jgi:hypothetical protein
VYQQGAVARGEGDDVGAGDDAGADGLDVRLDLVDDLEAADGVDVGAGALLAGKAPGDVVQKNRSIATLKEKKDPFEYLCTLYLIMNVLTCCAFHVCVWLKQVN